jgi:O-acetyl-ADP-ribose deacetylase (regulator of RNase III)
MVISVCFHGQQSGVMRGMQMIKIVKGDLLSVNRGIIGHQVNCQGKMGSGVANKVKNNIL